MSQKKKGLRLCIIGAGKMAKLVAARALASSLSAPLDICVSRGRKLNLAERHMLLENFPQCEFAASNREAAACAAVIVLAVRPDDLEVAARDLKGVLTSDQVVVSIVTGKSLAVLGEALGTQNIVRCCTNISLEIGRATTLWKAHPGVGSGMLARARKVLRNWGAAREISKEANLNVGMVAVGSLPALYIEIFAAVERALLTHGMSHDDAKFAALSVGQGTLALCDSQNGRACSEIQKRVLTPGGITVDMLLVADRGALRAVVIDAIGAAVAKTMKLGQEKGGKS